jgi:hypothetical protein
MVQPLHRQRTTATRCALMLAAPSRDWNVCTQSFTDHWDTFQRAHRRYQTPYYESLSAKRLACGTPEKMGSIADCCPHGGQGPHRVALRGKASLGVRCATVDVDNGVRQVSRGLQEGVLARHILLTVPAMCRTTVCPNAAVVLSAFMRCGAPCLEDC